MYGCYLTQCFIQGILAVGYSLPSIYYILLVPPFLSTSYFEFYGACRATSHPSLPDLLITRESVPLFNVEQ